MKKKPSRVLLLATKLIGAFHLCYRWNNISQILCIYATRPCGEESIERLLEIGSRSWKVITRTVSGIETLRRVKFVFAHYLYIITTSVFTGTLAKATMESEYLFISSTLI